ncbi:MAG: hypothetical protein CL920_22395 [Deltaproteobacteria bacterium]|nr:hypothetical protein [Deltaproteobacteria bacterium]MBU51449.1 hypothetical protein [Deltaproteobacteria bacterium]
MCSFVGHQHKQICIICVGFNHEGTQYVKTTPNKQILKGLYKRTLGATSGQTLAFCKRFLVCCT